PRPEVPLGAPAAVGLGHRADLERGEHARGDALLLHRVLERERVDHAREHAHVVGAGAVEALLRRLDTADHVAAPDHGADLDAELVDAAQVAGDARDHRRRDAEAAVAREVLAGELDQDPAVRGLHAPAASPSLKRRKPVTRIDPPVRAATSPTTSPTERSGSFTKACSTRHTSAANLLSFPSTMRSITFAGLPSCSACAR